VEGFTFTEEPSSGRTTFPLNQGIFQPLYGPAVLQHNISSISVFTWCSTNVLIVLAETLLKIPSETVMIKKTIKKWLLRVLETWIKEHSSPAPAFFPNPEYKADKQRINSEKRSAAARIRAY
jgi:hypothetical protein